MREIIEKIKNKQNFSEIPIHDFAPDGSWASEIARNLKTQMKTTQLRKVFTVIKDLEIKTKGKKDSEQFTDEEIYMLIPLLAYAKGRKLITEEFYNLIKVIIGDGKTTKIKTIGDYTRFAKFMTAIIAYTKQD